MGTDIKRVAVIGTGVIGASWTALFLAKGLEVTATDVAPGAEERLRQFVADAWPALVELGAVTHGPPDQLKFSNDLESAVEGAQLVQENGPERIDFKKALYGQLDAWLPRRPSSLPALRASTMSEIHSVCLQRIQTLCHRASVQSAPSHPPGGDFVGGARTSADTIRRVTDFYKYRARASGPFGFTRRFRATSNRLQAAPMA